MSTTTPADRDHTRRNRVIFAIAFWVAVANVILALASDQPSQHLAMAVSMLVLGTFLGYTANTLMQLRQLRRAATNVLLAEHSSTICPPNCPSAKARLQAQIQTQAGDHTPTLG